MSNSIDIEIKVEKILDSSLKQLTKQYAIVFSDNYEQGAIYFESKEDLRLFVQNHASIQTLIPKLIEWGAVNLVNAIREKGQCNLYGVSVELDPES